MPTTLLIRKDRLADTRLREAPDTPLAEGQVRVAPETLALTANNVTYAAFGEQMDYWRFYPSGEDGWGIVPAWGFGRVVQSLHPGVAVGERLYGYWPLASTAVLQPDRLSAAGFREGSPHRAQLHGVYNQYQRCCSDPFYAADSEREQAVLRPLFATSWLIEDFLADNGFFGAKRILLSSASSKTAYGTAFFLARRSGLDVVGLTSPRNVAFCEGLGCYSRVLTYDALDTLPAGEPSVYVDFSGDAPFRRRLHERFQESLKHSAAVGATHVGHLGGAKGLAGPPATLFFAPAQSAKRAEDWGGAGFQLRLVAGWQDFLGHVRAKQWLTLRTHAGPQAAATQWQAMVAGQVDPREGHLLAWR
ncbi:DUF2855 family protein [Ramlibacter algicola]|uniref:DUF2855 family protein n=1 Tax=Ramlibacter algicola TaxID=2795217 RepID=A0A934PWC0_9BURK|nr:DUF2855 family protein [Ramlibacter algicola]MBK0391684.1 DUF2855 family protein [Ramlibacter algicola]